MCGSFKDKDDGHFLFRCSVLLCEKDIPMCYLWRAAIGSDEWNQPRISAEEEKRGRHMEAMQPAVAAPPLITHH